MKFFWNLDKRLLNELKSQRRPIALGLGCVIVTSLLTTVNIALIDRAVDAISNATPIKSSFLREDPFIKLRDSRVKEVAKQLQIDPDRLQQAIDSTDSASKKETASEADSRRQSALTNLGWIALIIVGVFAVKYVFTRGQSYYLSQAANQLASNLRIRLFAKVQRLPISYFNQQRTGAIQSVLTNDVSVYQTAVMIIRDSIDGPIKAVAALITIIVIQPLLALVVALTAPLVWFVIQRNGRKMKQAQRDVQDNLAELNAVTQESLLGTRVVKAFGAEERMDATFKGHVDRALKSQLRAARRVATLKPLMELIGAIALAATLYICGWLAFGGTLKISNIAALMYALDVINQGFRSLGYVNNTYNQVQAASQRIHDLVLDVPVEQETAGGTKTLPSASGRIAFEKVSFTYADGTEALRNVSFVLEPGTSLALVGPSGSGKSTIADLLLRFYEPSCGRITFDGVDVQELSVPWLRNQIGVVPQQNFLFAGSLAENLRLGNPSASEDELAEATRVAHADVFIEQLPGRLETTIGERGVGLSGGEMQRIAIARALARDPVVLLLDEATSALDAHSEKAVQEALEDVMKERTTLFIAHRLTTAARADRILVLRRGEVVESGSHRELMAKGGPYASMMNAFQSGVIDETIG